jgi:hypothetical protein
VKPNCFVAGTLILANGMLIHIENVKILEEVDSDSLVNLSESTLSDLQEITPQSHRVLELRLEKADGSLVQVLLVRPLSWIETEKAELHRSLFLNLPEMGVRGNAKIVSISECSADSRLLSTGKRLVTGIFVHENAKVFDLYFEALEKPIGVTASHPFYSLSRNTWVSASQLYPSELVKTKDGSATFLYKKARAGLHCVYNLEIHRDHNYYVSEHKLLVHNNSGKMKEEAGKKSDGTEYTDYVVYDKNGIEEFVGRLENGELEIGWTGKEHTTLSRIAEAQQKVGSDFIKVVKGYASDNLKKIIDRGDFDVNKATEGFNKYLQGNWSVRLQPEGNKIWVIAEKK